MFTPPRALRKPPIIVGVLFLIGLGVVLALLFQQEDVSQEDSIEWRTIGTSIEGRSIDAFTFTPVEVLAASYTVPHLLFVGGVHGGYEWNSTLLAYEFIDYVAAYPDSVPNDLIISIIPTANPDGLYDVLNKEGRFALSDVPEDEGEIGNGRFNAREVDLNRNFDCKWEAESTWRGNEVSAGTRPFSEPETRTIRDFILETQPDAVIFWHSQASAVYASECEDGILPETLALMQSYANAAGYEAVDSFDAYPVTGDAEGWLASIGIPAVTVELSTHETVEWQQNLAGINAVFDLYSRVGR